MRLKDLRLDVSHNLGTLLHLRLLHGGSVCNEIQLYIYDSRHARELAELFRRTADELEHSAAQSERLSVGAVLGL